MCALQVYPGGTISGDCMKFRKSVERVTFDDIDKMSKKQFDAFMDDVVEDIEKHSKKVNYAKRKKQPQRSRNSTH